MSVSGGSVSSGQSGLSWGSTARALEKSNGVHVFPSIVLPQVTHILSGNSVTDDDTANLPRGTPKSLLTAKRAALSKQSSRLQREGSSRAASMGSFNDMANDPLAVKRPHFELPGHLKLNNEKETPDFLKSAEPSNHGEEDAQMLELRSYFERMDKFSMGTLVVWQGKVMEDSPEFKEFKRSNAHKWGAICVVLRALEEMAGMYGIKMAVVDCAKVVECALLALSHYYPETLLSCITNRSTVEMQMRSLRNSTGANQHLRAAILFQN